MIKKINIALAICFVALFAMKGLKQMKKEKASRPKEVAVVQTQSANLPAPDVYYIYWSSYSVVDPISNRNGVLLDIIRAIFPEAKFHRLRADVPDIVKVLKENPRAVVVGLGAHPDLALCRSAPTPLVHTGYVLMTLRSNPWRYTGPDSLKNLKIAARKSLLECAGLRKLHAQNNKEGKSLLRVVPTEASTADLAAMVEKGEVDAFAATGAKDMGGASAGRVPEHLTHKFRVSEEIGSEPSLLYVSSLDEEFSKRVVEEYEKGLIRIQKSGERRRILEFYSKPE